MSGTSTSCSAKKQRQDDIAAQVVSTSAMMMHDAHRGGQMLGQGSRTLPQTILLKLSTLKQGAYPAMQTESDQEEYELRLQRSASPAQLGRRRSRRPRRQPFPLDSSNPC